MQLYLLDDHSNQRAIVLCTGFEEERNGTPKRALVFRCLEDNVAKVTLEFLPKDEVNFRDAIRLTTRRVKGCLGIINVGEGAYTAILYYFFTDYVDRYIPCNHLVFHGCGQLTAFL